MFYCEIKTISASVVPKFYFRAASVSKFDAIKPGFLIFGSGCLTLRFFLLTIFVNKLAFSQTGFTVGTDVIRIACRLYASKLCFLRNFVSNSLVYFANVL